MKYLLFVFSIFVFISSAYSDDEPKVLSQMLCNTTHERKIFQDGSEENLFRHDDEPIKSAIITVRDYPKYTNSLWVEFSSPYVDESNKLWGLADFERAQFEIRFTGIYTKSDYTGSDFTGFHGNMTITYKRFSGLLSITRTNETNVSLLFMKCKAFK